MTGITELSSIQELKRQRKDLKACSLEGLIEACRNDGKAAWEEFFCRFNRLFIKTIKKTLIFYDKEALTYDEDVVADIQLEITEKLIVERVLWSGDDGNLRNPQFLPLWLKNVSRNQTISWLKKQNRQKNVPKQYENRKARRLDGPIDPDGNVLLVDTIAEEDQDEQREIAVELQTVTEEIEGLKELDCLIIKAALLYYNMLDDEDIAEIGQRRGVSAECISSEINELLDRLVQKNEDKIKKQARCVVVWHLIRKLESILMDLRKSPMAGHGEIEGIEKQIKEKNESLSRLRKGAKGLIRPTSKEIAALVGIKTDDARLINVRLHRIRKRLEKQKNG